MTGDPPPARYALREVLVHADPDARPPRRLAEPVASWVAFGATLGVVAPGAAITTFGLEVLFYGPYLVGSGLVGVLGGVLFGVVDPTVRWVSGGPARAIVGALAGFAALAAAGAVWAGLAGGLGAITMGLPSVLLYGNDLGFFVGVAAPLGVSLGLGAGAPAVVLFGLARLVAGRWGRPWIGTLVALLVGPPLAAGLGLLVFDALGLASL